MTYLIPNYSLVGRRNKSKSRRGRSSSDSNGPSHGSSSNGIATTLSSSSSHSNDRSTSSSSGENITVPYQSETCDLDACRGTNELNEESQTSTDITPTNESLRWNLIHQENQDQEEDRMRIYKINRRKRYMDVLQRNPDDRANQFYA